MSKIPPNALDRTQALLHCLQLERFCRDHLNDAEVAIVVLEQLAGILGDQIRTEGKENV